MVYNSIYITAHNITMLQLKS